MATPPIDVDVERIQFDGHCIQFRHTARRPFVAFFFNRDLRAEPRGAARGSLRRGAARRVDGGISGDDKFIDTTSARLMSPSDRPTDHPLDASR